MNQLNLYLPSDTWAQEYEIFTMLYGPRCVDGVAQSDLGHILKPNSRQTNGRASPAREGRRFDSCRHPQSAFYD